jgi:hypothetical protein
MVFTSEARQRWKLLVTSLGYGLFCIYSKSFRKVCVMLCMTGLPGTGTDGLEKRKHVGYPPLIFSQGLPT